MMREVKRAYDLESFELDNIYNEEEERYTRVESSIWYNQLGCGLSTKIATTFKSKSPERTSGTPMYALALLGDFFFILVLRIYA